MKAALYIRVSTEEQAIHGLSIAAQTEALDEWAKAPDAFKRAESQFDIFNLIFTILPPSA